jgi:CHAT domain-containing protein
VQELTKSNTAKAKMTKRAYRDFRNSEMEFEALSGTRDEAEAISAMLDIKPLYGELALESVIKRCRSPKILHIATHGFFLEDQKHDLNEDLQFSNFGKPEDLKSARWQAVHKLENPMLRSGLALAGANTWIKGRQPPHEAEDGILTAEDVTGMDLNGTELVVLSACETGLGEIKTGEGVFGLRRAFVLAGAKTLVMSLWKVPDEQTKELMVEFYKRILDGTPKAEALREAQLEIKEKYPDPLYWGAFICQGDPGSLNT